MSMTIVQNLVSQSSLASGGTISLPSNVTAGNHQIVEVVHSSTATITVTDSLGNTVTRRVAAQTIGTSTLSSYTIPVASTGASTITITYASGLARRVYLREVSDLDTSVSPIVAFNDANTANPVTSGSVTPTRDGALISSFFTNNGGGSYTAGSSLTERHDNGGYYVQDGIQATAAAIDPQATAIGPSTAKGVTIAYTPATTDTLVVNVEPSNAWDGEVIRPAVVVHLTTDGTTIDTGATDTVTAAIASGSGVLSGTTSVAAVAGVATFSNLVITGSGVHSLTFTATGYEADTSATFKVATGTGLPGTGATIISRGGDMDTIVKNSTDVDDLSIIVDAVDGAGVAVDISADIGDSTLVVGGSTLAEQTFTGTVTRRGTSQTHVCLFTQAQSNVFGIGEKGYIRIPSSTGALERTFPFLVTEAEIASAPFDFSATLAEATAVPSATASFIDKFKWMFALARNKITQTATTQLVRNDADSATIGTATVSDDGTTAIRGEFS